MSRGSSHLQSNKCCLQGIHVLLYKMGRFFPLLGHITEPHEIKAVNAHMYLEELKSTL